MSVLLLRHLSGPRRQTPDEGLRVRSVDSFIECLAPIPDNPLSCRSASSRATCGRDMIRNGSDTEIYGQGGSRTAPGISGALFA